MNRITKPGFIVSFSFLSIIFNCLIQPALNAQNVEKIDTPQWVNVQSPDLNFKFSADEMSGGYGYLLVDKQDNISAQSSYERFVIKIINNQGVQNMSDISTEFDPKYQKLAFHQIHLIRNGQVIDKLLSHSIKTVQRESDMDRFSYDGRLTAFVNLEDVRQGDIIDYSFSITGYNPRNDGHYFDECYFEYNLPVSLIYKRLIVPSNKKLYFKYIGQELVPIVSKSRTTTEYEWKIRNVKALLFDENTPSWYDPGRRVAITDFSSWKDVNNWIINDYIVSEAEKSNIKKELPAILKSKVVEDQIAEAIRFVQDNVRYLGFESGLSAYVPNPPGKVLARRYGDCKDKSLLLCAILQSIGVLASPVLVNTNHLPDEGAIIPSPYNFNHCIVQVFYGNQYWYIDPTLSNQGGKAGTFYVPEYGQGIVLREGTEGTTRVGGNLNMRLKVQSTFTLDSIGGSAVLNVRSTYEGGQADINRLYFASNSLDEISQSYINFYSDTYPGIKLTDKLVYWDDRENNIFEVDEKYFIDKFWKPLTNNKEKIDCHVYPLSLRSMLQIPSSASRKMPYKLQYPIDISEEITIKLPESWNVKPGALMLEDSAFYYNYTSAYEKNTIVLSYEYRSKTDHINPPGTSSLIADFNRILEDSAGYELSYNTTASKPFNFSWLMGMIALIFIAASSFVAYRLYFNYNLPSQSEPFMHEEIGGWLILIAIGLIVSPLSLIYNLISTTAFFDQKTIQIIFNSDVSNSLAWAVIVIFELIYNVSVIVFIGLLLILFFKKRTILPRLIMYFYALTAIVNLADYYLIKRFVDFDFVDGNTSTAVMRSILVAFIWIPYFLFSKRVKNTFVVEIQTKRRAKDNDLFFEDPVYGSTGNTLIPVDVIDKSFVSKPDKIDSSADDTIDGD
jgi:transglutaminase-like putative cysteine protease